MKNMKKLIAMLLALTMMLCLCACGSNDGEDGQGITLNDVVNAVLGYTTDDFHLLLQGNLDEIYLGKYDSKYMELLNTNEAECQANYEAGIAYEVDYFCYYFAVEYPTEEYLAKVTELYKEIYSHSKYTVGEVSPLDENTFVSKVTVSPINIFELTITAIENGALDHFYNKYPDNVVNAMTDEEYEAYNHEWGEEVLKVVKDQLPNIGYCEEQTMAVQIVLEDNVWQISSTDLQSLDALIIAYP